MKACLEVLEVATYGPLKLHRVTELVRKAVERCGVRNGVTRIDVAGATPALLLVDPADEDAVLRAITKLVPITGWRHGNAYAHLVSTVVTTSLHLAIENRSLVIPRGYEIYLLETRPVHNHRRKLAIEIVGEP